MSTDFKSKYVPFPKSSPYTTASRYETPKETAKQTIEFVKKTVDTSQSLRVADICCGNAEFLYLLKKNFPHWDLSGYDYVEEFIETGRSFPGLDSVNLNVCNLYDIEATQPFDLIFCQGSFQAFQDPQPPLEKLLSLVKDNGFLFIDSMFNKYNVDVKIQFCDNSRDEMKNIWRSDFNQHSYHTMKELLKGKVKSYEFHELYCNVDIPYQDNKPATFCFSFRDENGKNVLMNGMNVVIQDVLLLIQK